jgi:hypothetical protein
VVLKIIVTKNLTGFVSTAAGAIIIGVGGVSIYLTIDAVTTATVEAAQAGVIVTAAAALVAEAAIKAALTADAISEAAKTAVAKTAALTAETIAVEATEAADTAAKLSK